MGVAFGRMAAGEGGDGFVVGFASFQKDAQGEGGIGVVGLEREGFAVVGFGTVEKSEPLGIPTLLDEFGG